MNEQPIFNVSPLERVREGMPVLDSHGRQVGTVTRVHVSEPDEAPPTVFEPSSLVTPGAVLAAAPTVTDVPPGVLGFPWAVQDLEDLTHERREALRRSGFIQVEGPGVSGADRFLPGDRIAEVTADAVRLHRAPSESVPQATPPAAATRDDQPSYRVEQPVERIVVTPATNRRAARGWLAARVLVPLGALLASAIGVGGWLYARRRREQSRPIHQVRRAVRTVGKRLPGGAAGPAALLALLLLLRARRGEEVEDRPARQEARSAGVSITFRRRAAASTA